MAGDAGSPTASKPVPRTSASGQGATAGGPGDGVKLPRCGPPSHGLSGAQLAAGQGVHKPVSLPPFGRPVGGLVYLLMQEQYKQQ